MSKSRFMERIGGLEKQIDEARRESKEATQALQEINGLYQDIEDVLESDEITRNGKLALISGLNKKIGDLTGSWV